MLKFHRSSPQNNEVSVLFSEPKIPQFITAATEAAAAGVVSVLFSEPKIPQSIAAAAPYTATLVSVLFSEPKIPQSCLEVQVPEPG